MAHVPGPAAKQAVIFSDWESVYRGNVGWIRRMIFARVGNRQDAEDLTAEVFAAALRSLRVPATQSEIRAYLALTARSALAVHWKRVLGLDIIVTDIEEVAAPATSHQRTNYAASTVTVILARLPERYRSVLELRFLYSYSIRETAAVLGISVGNVRVLQHRALRFAAELKEP